MRVDLIELQDGLLADKDKIIMKARDPELFPTEIQAYFVDKEKVQSKKIEFGVSKVVVKTADKRACFDPDLVDYVKELGRVNYFLSNVPLPGEDIGYYPLFAKYKHGWVCISPLGVA